MSNYQPGLKFVRKAVGFYHVINIHGELIGMITRGREKKGTWWNVIIERDVLNALTGQFKIKDPHLMRSYVGFVDAKDWFRDPILSILHSYQQ